MWTCIRKENQIHKKRVKRLEAYISTIKLQANRAATSYPLPGYDLVSSIFDGLGMYNQLIKIFLQLHPFNAAAFPFPDSTVIHQLASMCNGFTGMGMIMENPCCW